MDKEGERLSRDEMIAMVFLLLFAGHETTTHLISGSAFELLQNRALRDWLAIALVIVASAGATANVGAAWSRSSPPAVD